MNVKEHLNRMKNKIALSGLLVLGATSVQGHNVDGTSDSIQENKKELSDVSNQNNRNVENENTEWKTTKDGIRYALTPNGLKFQASISLNTQNLMPKTYEVEDNGQGKRVFECGGTYSQNKSVLNKMVSEKIKKIIISNSIVKDIKASYGEDIPLQAANFINNTEKNMQKLGLIEKDGKYFQINPDMTHIEGHVNDKNALEKQKEKDIKDAAKYVQKRMNSQQLAFNGFGIQGEGR